MRDLGPAAALLDEGLALRRGLGDRRGGASIQGNLELVALARGDHVLALPT